MESITAVVSESPKAKEEANNVGSGGNIKISEKPYIVALTLVPTAAAHHHDKVPSITSPAETESPQEKKMKKKQKNKIQVSNTKKPFIFYLNLSKRYINEHNEVELCALGMDYDMLVVDDYEIAWHFKFTSRFPVKLANGLISIPTVVTIAEILKRKGLAIEKRITTSTVLSPEEDLKGRRIEKAKIEIVLEKAEKLDKTNAPETPKKA
ncbi:Alba DNA/RNA-binding-like protein [Theobroma cacao]|uniref:Alba DNA/RNA-binding-like protein n=1 Tax=Theobroma cacao TaxID=3641 RepID=A0A061EM51_THECC|nr:Alba DNA/RNA-binding-like protein [Theobroma cacao]